MNKKKLQYTVLGSVMGGIILLFLFLSLDVSTYSEEKTYTDVKDIVVHEVAADSMYTGKVVENIREVVLTKPEEREVRALYITAYTAGNKDRLEQILNILDQTSLNALVIDIKDYSGNVFFDTEVAVAQDLGLVKNRLGDVQSLIELLHERDVYVIARLTAFQDPALAQAKPEWAIKDTRGGLWKDYKGLTWVDLSQEEVWEYTIDIAQDAIRVGFDEINFDYIRFPSDGPLSYMKFKNYDGTYPKHELLRRYFEKVYERLQHEPAYLSADLFGLTTIREDDMTIGQLLEDAAPYFDYIMPMMYPSHYPAGFNGFSNPAQHPYEVIYPGVVRAVERLDAVEGNRAKIRPWIQDFDIGAVYGRQKVQAQIQAISDGGGYGFASWNARNVYVLGDYK